MPHTLFPSLRFMINKNKSKVLRSPAARNTDYFYVTVRNLVFCKQIQTHNPLAQNIHLLVITLRDAVLEMSLSCLHTPVSKSSQSHGSSQLPIS